MAKWADRRDDCLKDPERNAIAAAQRLWLSCCAARKMGRRFGWYAPTYPGGRLGRYVPALVDLSSTTFVPILSGRLFGN